MAATATKDEFDLKDEVIDIKDEFEPINNTSVTMKTDFKDEFRIVGINKP